MVLQRQFFFLIVICSCTVIKATDYLAIGDSESYVDPCNKEDDRGNVPFDQFMDLSNMVHTYSEDYETTYCNGYFMVKMALPDTPIKMQSNVLKWQRGEWVNTVWSLYREDFCKTLENPMEFWYTVVKKIPKEQRVCPPKLGAKYTLINSTNHIRVNNLPMPNLAGVYKIITHVSAGNVTICTTVHMTVKKV